MGISKNINLCGNEAKLQFMVFQKLCCEKSEISFWYIRNDIMKDQKDFWYFSDAFHPKAPPTTPFGLLWYVNSSVPKWKFKYKLKRKLFISEKIVSNIYHFFACLWTIMFSFNLTCNEYGQSEHYCRTWDSISINLEPCTTSKNTTTYNDFSSYNTKHSILPIFLTLVLHLQYMWTMPQEIPWEIVNFLGKLLKHLPQNIFQKTWWKSVLSTFSLKEVL